jgi:hypothetical protein
MIAYEELDRALARWKARSQNGAVAAGEADLSSAREVVEVAAVVETAAIVEAAAIVEDGAVLEEGADIATPLPIRSEELGSIPNLAAPTGERTGEIQVSELETYEDDDA